MEERYGPALGGVGCWGRCGPALGASVSLARATAPPSRHHPLPFLRGDSRTYAPSKITRTPTSTPHPIPRHPTPVWGSRALVRDVSPCGRWVSLMSSQRPVLQPSAAGGREGDLGGADGSFPRGGTLESFVAPPLWSRAPLRGRGSKDSITASLGHPRGTLACIPVLVLILG